MGAIKSDNEDFWEYECDGCGVEFMDKPFLLEPTLCPKDRKEFREWRESEPHPDPED